MLKGDVLGIDLGLELQEENSNCLYEFDDSLFASFQPCSNSKNANFKNFLNLKGANFEENPSKVWSPPPIDSTFLSKHFNVNDNLQLQKNLSAFLLLSAIAGSKKKQTCKNVWMNKNIPPPPPSSISAPKSPLCDFILKIKPTRYLSPGFSPTFPSLLTTSPYKYTLEIFTTRKTKQIGISLTNNKADVEVFSDIRTKVDPCYYKHEIEIRLKFTVRYCYERKMEMEFFGDNGEFLYRTRSFELYSRKKNEEKIFFEREIGEKKKKENKKKRKRKENLAGENVKTKKRKFE